VGFLGSANPIADAGQGFPQRSTDSKEESPMAEAYCVKDKRKVEVLNPQRITIKNGKAALQGTCPICGGKVFKIGG
jgi:hypothetical protein